MNKGQDIELTREFVVAESAHMRDVMAKVERIAGFRTTVLINGESGTGKDLIARAIHLYSPFRNSPFVSVNCAALPATLFESELFGHTRGAFSGAVKDKHGFFTEANGGTLVLEEVGEIPLASQAKLLRVLQEGTFRKLGALTESKSDARIIATTSEDLHHAVVEGRFREDLYYRLNIVPLELKPLRERVEDILPLANRFLQEAGVPQGLDAVSEQIRAEMLKYDWPGNVRELQNVIERSVIMSDGKHIEIVSPTVRKRLASDEVTLSLPVDALSIKQALAYVVPEIESALIKRALRLTGNNRTRAAKLLEISHRSLLYKLKSYNCG
ncbi:MAG: sigma 54-interacting transcriptional regulator [bacterium]|nr:sigma 54-interacting transcriptional regulator [bacterium]